MGFGRPIPVVSYILINIGLNQHHLTICLGPTHEFHGILALDIQTGLKRTFLTFLNIEVLQTPIILAITLSVLEVTNFF